MNFSSDIKIVLLQRKFHLVIIGKGRIFKRHHQNCLIFEKIIAHDNEGSSNVQMNSLNLGYFCKKYWIKIIIELKPIELKFAALNFWLPLELTKKYQQSATFIVTRNFLISDLKNHILKVTLKRVYSLDLTVQS